MVALFLHNNTMITQKGLKQVHKNVNKKDTQHIMM